MVRIQVLQDFKDLKVGVIRVAGEIYYDTRDRLEELLETKPGRVQLIGPEAKEHK